MNLRLFPRPLRGPAASLAEWIWENPALGRELRPRPPRLNEPKWRRILREGAAWSGLAAVIALYAAASIGLGSGQVTPWEARELLRDLCVLYLLLVTLTLPGPAAAAITSEEERRAWSDLLLTRLRPSQLLVAKWLALLVPALRMLVLLLPVWIPLYREAHLAPEHGPLLLLVLVLTPAAVSAGCLALSTRFRRTMAAVTVAYLATGLLCWGSLAILDGNMIRHENLWWYASPAWHVSLLCALEPSRSPMALPLLPEWAWFAALYPVLTAVCLRYVTRCVARAGNRP